MGVENKFSPHISRDVIILIIRKLLQYESIQTTAKYIFHKELVGKDKKKYIHCGGIRRENQKMLGSRVIIYIPG